MSTLPLLSKVFEKTMHKRIIKFFSKFNIRFSDQFGYLSKFIDNSYSNFNDKNILILVFIDLSKAFDTLDFDILLNKMERYGIRGSVKDWFSSYLKNRYQYVNIGGSFSPLTPLKMVFRRTQFWVLCSS